MRRPHLWAGLVLAAPTASADPVPPDRFTEPASAGYVADPFA